MPSILEDLRQLGVKLWHDDAGLHYRAPRSLVEGDLVDLLRLHKGEVVELLRQEQKPNGGMVYDSAEPSCDTGTPEDHRPHIPMHRIPGPLATEKQRRFLAVLDAKSPVSVSVTSRRRWGVGRDDLTRPEAYLLVDDVRRAEDLLRRYPAVEGGEILWQIRLKRRLRSTWSTSSM